MSDLQRKVNYFFVIASIIMILLIMAASFLGFLAMSNMESYYRNITMSSIPGQIALTLFSAFITLFLVAKVFGMFFVDLSQKLDRIATALEAKK